MTMATIQAKTRQILARGRTRAGVGTVLVSVVVVYVLVCSVQLLAAGT